jgi:nucleotide-binding universal stress UspA family protein
MSLFHKILVPLDGSPLADRILSQVRRCLRTTDGEVWLLRVMPEYLVEGSSWVPERVTEDIHRHLDRVRDELVAQGVRAFSKIRTGDPAAVILDEAERVGATCIAMSTHGRSGLGRWLMGSVAERVLRNARAPVLLANRGVLEGTGAGGAEGRFARIVVPLDGSDKAAQIVPLVEELGRLYESAAVLLHVQAVLPAAPDPYFVAMPPIATVAEGEALLQSHRERLEAAGVPVRTLVITDRPAHRILQTAAEEKADLIAMTTHGYSGIARWAYGSVAEKVLRHSPCPLLVLRTAEAGSESESA